MAEEAGKINVGGEGAQDRGSVKCYLLQSAHTCEACVVCPPMGGSGAMHPRKIDALRTFCQIKLIDL